MRRIVAILFTLLGFANPQIGDAKSRPPHYWAWMCIHRYEGAWNANTGNGYSGGLQFGYSEWRRFGQPFTGKPYAHQASPLEQMWAAERYHRQSGFYPWPRTARMCGLI
jgi:hypothetical protein